MSKKGDNLQELLAYKDSHAPWFWNELSSPALVKRNLKLIRGLSGSSKMALEELDQLTEQDIKSTLSAYKKRSKQSADISATPTTASQFFHSTLSKSPYFCEIIPYSERIHNSPTKSQPILVSASEQTNSDIPSKTEPVHGFHLNEGEAFSSTRYFSDDKKSRAQIIAKNGAFKATHQNLNNEQKTDLAFEMSYQFLLNLSPKQKKIKISGSPEMVHRLHAALLCLQKESGARYADVTFKLPKEITTAPEEDNESYIKKHLGTLHEPPQQLAQWRDFIKMDLSTPANARETTPPSIEKEKITALINMERIFKAPDLSQEDKVLLNEYQRYLKDVWVDGLNELKGKTGAMITEHVDFMQRTESALRLFKKAPSLEKEFTALRTLYIKTSESHQELLETLHQTEVEYETRVKELMPQHQKARREALEECIHCVSEHLDMEISLNPNLSIELSKSLQIHAQALLEISDFIQDKEELSDDMMRSYGAQMLQALHCLEPIRDYSKSALFQHMKDYSKKQSEINVEITKTQPQQLIQASNTVKERLNQFKKELQEPNNPGFLLSSETKEQLETLIDNVNGCINGFETAESKASLYKLLDTLNQIIEAPKLSQEQTDAFHQNIDKVVPHIKTNPKLIEELFEIKTLMTVTLESAPLLPEPGKSTGLAM